MYITADPRPMAAAPASALPSPRADAAPVKSVEQPVDSVILQQRPDEMVEVVSSIAGYASGAVAGLMGFITNGCAGGAHGVVRGLELTGKEAEEGFQMAFASNLVVAGSVAYGPAAAVGILATGEQTWAQQPEELRQKVFAAVDNYMDKVTSQLPPAEEPHSQFRKLAQAAVGEVVGFVAGGIVGAQGGYTAGAEIGQKTIDTMADRMKTLPA